MKKCCGNLLDIAKLNALLNRKQPEPVEEKKNCTLKWILIIVGIVLVVGVVAFIIYKRLTPDYLEDFEDDFDDDFEDDFEDEFEDDFEDDECECEACDCETVEE